MTNPDTGPEPEDWYTVVVDAADDRLNINVIVQYQHYDAQLLDDGVLRIVLADRGAVYLFARDQWLRLEARPAPEGAPL